MKELVYNENTQELDVPYTLLAKGIAWAESKNYTQIKLVNPAKASSAKVDLAPLTSNAFITSFYITDDVKLKGVDLTPLYSMEKLTHLTMPYLKASIDFNAFKGLKALYITKADGELENLSIATLEDLMLNSTKNTDCRFFSSLDKLKRVRISSTKITTLAGITAAPALQSLSLTYSPNLTDITEVNELAQLSTLYVEKCKELKDFAFLAKNRAIEELFLADLDSVAFVPGMAALKRMKFWNLVDGNMAPLLNSSTLQEVDFYPMKKHYSHSKEAINAQLAK